MSMIKRAKTVLSPAIAGLTLLVLAASPTLANNHNQTVTTTQPSNATNSAKLTQQQISQRTAPRNQMTQPTNQMGCPCCKSMMNNMPGMTGGQNN